MLVLTRKFRQQITIGQDIVVTVLAVKGNAVRIGIEAPDSVKVMRTEIAGTPPKPRGVEAESEGEAPSPALPRRRSAKRRQPRFAGQCPLTSRPLTGRSESGVEQTAPRAEQVAQVTSRREQAGRTLALPTAALGERVRALRLAAAVMA